MPKVPPFAGPHIPEEQQIVLRRGIQYSSSIEIFLIGVFGLALLAGYLDNSLWPKLVLKGTTGPLQYSGLK
jgi:hypothetical protein